MTKKYYQTTYPELSNRPMRAVIGTISELRVAADLFLRGYYVFHALSPHCPSDLVALKHGQLTSFEVRTAAIVKGTGKVNVNKNKRADVLAIVLADKIIYEPPIETFSS